MKTQRINACPKCGAAVPPDAPQGLCPQCVLAAAATPEVASTATSQIPSIERLAAAFPQLQILELIGRGGMGFVFKARQPQLDRLVALKLLPDSLAHDAHFAERFNREGRTLARLNHPNIVSIFDFGHTGAPASSPAYDVHPPKAGEDTGAPSQSGFYYLLMEYVDGVNLREAMQAGRFSPAEALAIVPKICEALQYAHEEGVLHRDIKPENILLDSKGRVKIADFGIAKIVGDDKPDISLTATGAALGTPHYMAPEQFEKPATVDHRADIYSLGVVFYELLTGELPLGRFGPPSAKTPVDSRVDDVAMRTLEREREKRFQSAGFNLISVQCFREHAPKFSAQPNAIFDTASSICHTTCHENCEASLAEEITRNRPGRGTPRPQQQADRGRTQKTPRRGDATFLWMRPKAVRCSSRLTPTSYSTSPTRSMTSPMRCR